MHKSLKVRIYCPKSKKMWLQQDIVLECLTQQINFDNNSEIGIKYNHVGEEGSVFTEFTGWKDKNDNEIYTGDVLEDDFRRLYIVKKYPGSFCFQIIKQWADGTFEEMSVYNSSFYSKKYFKIIGNIYQNPEFTRGIPA